jgi:hypothetical protein
MQALTTNNDWIEDASVYQQRSQRLLLPEGRTRTHYQIGRSVCAENIDILVPIVGYQK